MYTQAPAQLPLPAMPSSDRDSLAEDTEVLRAVLAFLDDDVDNANVGEPLDVPTPPLSDADSGSLSESESVAESTGSSGKSAPRRRARKAACSAAAPPVINRSRMRRRHEVLSLREQVIALEERLAALHSGGDIVEPEDKSVAVSAWQSIAECQREQLADAEKERERLRASIKEYKLSVKRVERFLKKQTLPAFLLDPALAKLMARSNASEDSKDSTGFEEISQNLPAMYLQINGVFSDPRYDAPMSGLRDVRVQNAETMNMSIEVLQSRLLPFSVGTTAKAVWHFHQIKSTKVAKTVEENVEESENLLRRTFVALLEMPNHKSTARGRMEARRFIEHDRVVILECALFDSLESITGSGPNCFGMRLFHWTVIGPPRSESLRRSGRALSQVESFEVSLPCLTEDDSTGDKKTALAEFKTFCMEASNFMHDLERQAVENILMNLTVNGK